MVMLRFGINIVMKKHSTRPLKLLGWLKKGLRLVFYTFVVIGLSPLVLLVALMTYNDEDEF